MEILELWNAVRPALGSALLLVGAVLALIGTIGVTISWLWVCSNNAPAAAPTFLKIIP